MDGSIANYLQLPIERGDDGLGFLNGGCGPADRVEHNARLGSIGTWLLSTSVVVAAIRFATKRCSSGWTVRSLLAAMYQQRSRPCDYLRVRMSFNAYVRLVAYKDIGFAVRAV